MLQLKEVEKPIPGEDEVLIKVYAASINDWDWGLLLGTTFINRLMYGMNKPNKTILGSDIAGRIEAIGKNVKQFKIGDEVYGDLSGHWGGFAEFVCAKEKNLALKPSGMSFEEAASIPQAAMLAVQGLIDVGQVKRGSKLLLNGAGGGVGTFALQIAKQYQVEITAVDRSQKLEKLHALGAHYVIDYTKEDFTNNGKHYDLILDVQTNRSVFKYLRALSPHGVYVTVGGSMARLFQVFTLGSWISKLGSRKIRIVALKPNKDLGYMNTLFEKGIVKPVIDSIYRLEDLPDAMRHFGQGNHQGKVVITINQE